MTARRLSLLDTSFLQLESARAPMHVAGLLTFDPPANAKPEFVGELVQRLRACQVFRNPWNYRLPRAGRLQFRPVLEEVHDIDMEYHVRHLALPRPGGERELGQLIARLHSQRLEQRKPLWELHVIEGLEHGRFALYLKIHHALVDGMSATQLLMRALSTEADAVGQLPFWAAADASTRDMPRAQQRQKSRRASLPKAADLFTVAKAAAGEWVRKGDGDDDVSMRSAPRTILNDRIHSQRRFATHSESLSRLKTIAKAANCSLNDLVLALTGTVVREYLMGHDALPSQGLTASIPVSLHMPGDKVEIGNKVGMMFATLGTHIADERSRLDAIRKSTAKAKSRMQALPAGTLGLYSSLMLAPYVGSMVTGLAGRSGIKPAFNVVVSNVPGPQETRYLFGARLANMFPVSVPTHGSALNVTCFSCAGQFNFGLTACRDSVPHVQQMAVGLGKAVERYEEIYCGKVSAIQNAA